MVLLYNSIERVPDHPGGNGGVLMVRRKIQILVAITFLQLAVHINTLEIFLIANMASVMKYCDQYHLIVLFQICNRKIFVC